MYADQWKQDERGWWCEKNDGTYYVNQWQWLDVNNDQIYERYYFGPDGYLLVNTNTPDGSIVNGDGAWVVNGVVQTMTLRDILLILVYDSAGNQYKDICCEYPGTQLIRASACFNSNNELEIDFLTKDSNGNTKYYFCEYNGDFSLKNVKNHKGSDNYLSYSITEVLGMELDTQQIQSWK